MLNLFIYFISSFIPRLIVFMFYTIYLFRKNNMNVYQSNHSLNNIHELVNESIEKSMFKNLNSTNNELFMLKWNIGLAIFIYLLITII
jgi:hypothetical protein